MTEPASFEALYRALAPQVRRYAERQVGADLADEVVVDAFTAVWRRRADLPAADDERRAWVFGVARLTARAVARRHRDGLPAAPARLRERIEADHADEVVGRDRVSRLLAALPPREREAMELTVWSGLTPAQAARVLGCSQTALTSRLARARRRLDAVLGAESASEQGVHRVR